MGIITVSGKNEMSALSWMLFCSVILTGCGGGTVALPLASRHTTATPTPSFTPGLMLAGSTASTVSLYSTAAFGNVAPLRIFPGNAAAGVGKNGAWVLNGPMLDVFGRTLGYSGATRYSLSGSALNSLEFRYEGANGAAAATTDLAGNLYVVEGALKDVIDLDAPVCPFFNITSGQETIAEYSVNSTQASRPIRSFEISACDAYSIAVDKGGHVWVAFETLSIDDSGSYLYTPTIVQYAFKTDNSAMALRKLGGGFRESIAIDSTERLYTLDSFQLNRYDSNSQEPEVLLRDVYIKNNDGVGSIAIDAHDDVFLLTANIPKPAISEYRFPSKTPLRVITGPSTLVGGLGLAVTR